MTTTETTVPTVRALIVVDVQNDFVEGGSLAVAGGLRVAEGVTGHLDRTAGTYAAVVASRDWHDPEGTNDGHFPEPGQDPDYVTTWPVHCVAGTRGADYAPGLDTTRVTHHVRKGQGVPAYSAFQGRLCLDEDAAPADGPAALAEVLADLAVTDLDVVGIATDYCVRATCLDAAAAGYRVRLLTGLCAGVAPESTTAALAELAGAGVEIA